MVTTIGQIERATQHRVIKLFREQLGYDYLEIIIKKKNDWRGHKVKEKEV